MSSYYDDDDYDDIDDGEVSHVVRMAAVPDRVRNLPQDHNKKKSKRAREAEANGGFIELTVAGVDLRVPVNGKLPVKAAVAYNNGDEFGGTEIMLGEDQWNSFLDANPTLDDYNELSDAVKDASGNS